MTPDQKQELRRKKFRFDELSAEEQQHLRELHHSIVTDPNAEELVDTVTRYNRWLANLDASERSDLLDIKEPEKRIEPHQGADAQAGGASFSGLCGELAGERSHDDLQLAPRVCGCPCGRNSSTAPSFIRQRIDDAPDEASRASSYSCTGSARGATATCLFLAPAT